MNATNPETVAIVVLELVCLVQYETALIDLINLQRAGKPVTPEERPAASNVVDLMEALRQSVGREAVPAKAGKPSGRPFAHHEERRLESRPYLLISLARSSSPSAERWPGSGASSICSAC